MTGSGRIIVNTMASYIRLAAMGIAGLLATPIALHRLGTGDYGIFAVIGGTLTFLMFINVALSGGAQRHIAFALGSSNLAEARKWFTASFLIHACVALALGGTALMCSQLVLGHVLNIPPSRLHAAVWIYRMTVTALVADILSAPYQAFLMAHEEMLSISIMSVASCVTLIVGTFSLGHLRGDLLLWYAGIYTFSQVVYFTGPMLMCELRYREGCRPSREGFRRQYVTDLLSYSSWNLFGALSGIVRGQGPAILLNRFFGASSNAAYGIALQVNGAATNISSGVLRATTPPIVKRHASGDQQGMVLLSNASNRYAFGLLWLAIAPLLFETNFCLAMWLRKVPANTGAFVDLLVIALLIDQLTLGFGASVQATGRIAGYQLAVAAMNCLPVPVGYLLLRMAMPATSILWAGIGTAVLAAGCRIWFGKAEAGLSIADWARTVLIPCCGCVIASAFAVLVPLAILQAGFVRFSLVAAANFVAASFILWRYGTLPEHRARIRSSISGARQRLFNFASPSEAT